MKTKAVAALAVIMALVMAACSDNDEPIGPQSIAASYLTPTSMRVSDINSMGRKWRNCTTIAFIFQGEMTPGAPSIP